MPANRKARRARRASGPPRSPSPGPVAPTADQTGEVVRRLERVVRLNPRDATAWHGLASALLWLERPIDALKAARRFAALDPSPAARGVLAVALYEAGEYQEAVPHARASAEADPGDKAGRVLVACCLVEGGRFDAALAEWERVAADFPDDLQVLCRFSGELHRAGDLARGRALYRRVWSAVPATRPGPAWEGGPGGTLLIHAGAMLPDSRLGDYIQLVRYVPLAAERAGRVVLECPRPMAPLLSRIGGAEVAAEGGETGAYDAQLGVLLLPSVLSPFGENDARGPYLSASPEAVARWRPAVGALPGLKVGVHWRASDAGVWRTFPLAAFAPLAAVGGVSLVSLQAGPGAAEIGSAPFPVRDIGILAEDSERGAFTATAAAMESLDLIISNDSAVAHLAGALGRPAWVALPLACDPRWGVGRDGTNLYASTRLFRQPRPGDWGPVFDRMAGELRRLVCA